MLIKSYTNMLKVARKPSSDPVQEKLRNNKALWNKEISVFINDLIHLKKTMNGWPSKFYQEKSFIKEPIPGDPVSILGVLTGDFQEIAQKGNGIVQEQLDYAKNRRKRQPKQLNLPLGEPQQKAPEEPAAPQPDLTNQLALPNIASAQYELIKIASNLEDKYSLEKQASNPVTRFFTRLFNPGVGWGKAADIRRARSSMLKYSAGVYKGLSKYQVMIVGSKNKISDAKRKLDQVHNDWENVAKAYVIYKQSSSINEPDKGGTIESQVRMEDEKEEKKLQGITKDEIQLKNQLNNEKSLEDKVNQNVRVTPPKPNTNIVLQSNVNRVVRDLLDNRVFLRGFTNAELSGFESSIERMMATQQVEPDFMNLYGDAISALNRDLGTSGISIGQIVRQMVRMEAQEKKNQEKEEAKVVVQNAPTAATPAAPAAPVDPANLLPDIEASQIEKVAQDFVKKWIGKNRLKMNPFDTTVSNRLSCFELAGTIRKELNVVMDLLEEGLDTSKLDPAIRDVNSKMLQLRGLTRTLHMGLPPEKRKAQ